MAVGEFVGIETGRQVVEEGLQTAGNSEDELGGRSGEDLVGVRDSVREVDEVVLCRAQELFTTSDVVHTGEYKERLVRRVMDVHRDVVADRGMAKDQAERARSLRGAREQASPGAGQRLPIPGSNDEA